MDLRRARASGASRHPQLLVREGDDHRGEVGVGPQDPEPVVPGALLDLPFVNRDVRALGLQKATVALVAHERLVAMRQGGAKGADHRLAIVAVLARLLGIQTNDVAMLADEHRFHLQRRRGVAGLAFGKDLREGAIRVDDRPSFVRAPHPHAKHVKPVAVFDRLDGLLADHAPVGHNADRLHRERLLQPIDDRDERLHVRGMARPHLAAHRIAIRVDDDAHHHLGEVGAMVLRMAAPTHRLSAGAFDIDRDRIEEHQRQGLVEKIPSARKQRFLDPIFLGTRSERRRPGLVAGGERLAEPSHRPVHVLQPELVRPFYRVVVFPPLGRAVTAGRHQAMQHRQEDRALDQEVETAPGQLPLQHVLQTALAPYALEDEPRSHARRVLGRALALKLCNK
jgi:hypothetical protein